MKITHLLTTFFVFLFFLTIPVSASPTLTVEEKGIFNLYVYNDFLNVTYIKSAGFETLRVVYGDNKANRFVDTGNWHGAYYTWDDYDPTFGRSEYISPNTVIVNVTVNNPMFVVVNSTRIATSNYWQYVYHYPFTDERADFVIIETRTTSANPRAEGPLFEGAVPTQYGSEKIGWTTWGTTTINVNNYIAVNWVGLKDKLFIMQNKTFNYNEDTYTLTASGRVYGHRNAGGVELLKGTSVHLLGNIKNTSVGSELVDLDKLKARYVNDTLSVTANTGTRFNCYNGTLSITNCLGATPSSNKIDFTITDTFGISNVGTPKTLWLNGFGSATNFTSATNLYYYNINNSANEPTSADLIVAYTWDVNEWDVLDVGTSGCNVDDNQATCGFRGQIGIVGTSTSFFVVALSNQTSGVNRRIVITDTPIVPPPVVVEPNIVFNWIKTLNKLWNIRVS